MHNAGFLKFRRAALRDNYRQQLLASYLSSFYRFGKVDKMQVYFSHNYFDEHPTHFFYDLIYFLLWSFAERACERPVWNLEPV